MGAHIRYPTNRYFTCSASEQCNFNIPSRSEGSLDSASGSSEDSERTLKHVKTLISSYGHIIRLQNSIFVNRYVCFYFPVVRLMAVEDELRGGAIPDIKPRILTDQVSACVYVFYHPYLLSQSCSKTVCIILTSYPKHLPKPEQGKSSLLSCASPTAIFQKHICVTSEITFHHLLHTPEGRTNPALSLEISSWTELKSTHKG